MTTSGSPLVILLVEEDPAHGARLREILAGQLGMAFAVEQVATLAAALAHQSDHPIDLVLLDDHLATCGGGDAVQRLTAVAPSMPIIPLREGSDDEPVANDVACSPGDWLVKGFPEPEPLLRVVRRVGDSVGPPARSEPVLARDCGCTMDPVTELPDHQGIELIMRQTVAAASGPGASLLMLLCDLDNFQLASLAADSGAADQVLRQVAARIRSAVRGSDVIGRAGDDQFVVLLPQTRAAEGMVIAERIRLAIAREPFAAAGGLLPITASFGLTMIGSPSVSFSEVLAKAHVALHRAQTLGKDRVACAVDPPGGRFARPVVLTQDLVESLLYEDVLQVASQPIVRLADGRGSARELLIRGPDGPLRHPIELFQFSRREGILTPVDLRCLGKCVAVAGQYRIEGTNHVNILPGTLLETAVPDLLRLLRGDAPGSRFCLEVCDQQLPSDPALLMPVIRSVQDQGVEIALAEIGARPGSLRRVELLRPRVIKIDRGVIKVVAVDNQRRRFLRQALQVARNLSIAVIAEGIETAEQRDALLDLGVEQGQGFRFGRPEIISSVTHAGEDILTAAGPPLHRER